MILAKYSVLVPLVAKSEKVEDVEKFLLAGYDLVKAEPETIQWFGIKFTSIIPQTYGIFDTFPTETGRGAHLTGEVAKALTDNAPELLSPAPAIGQAEVLASVVRSTEHAPGDKTAGLSVGVRVLMTAKADKVQAVRDFLIVRPNVVCSFTPWLLIRLLWSFNRAQNHSSKRSR